MNRHSARLTPRDIIRMLRQTAKMFGKPVDYSSCRPGSIRYVPPTALDNQYSRMKDAAP